MNGLELFLAAAAPAASGGLAEQFGIDAAVLIAQAINFLIVVTAFYFLALKPLLATVDERNAKIADGLKFAEQAEQTKAEAQAEKDRVVREAQQEAKKIVEAARADAKALAEREAKDSAARAEDLLRKGRETLALERAQALDEARAQVANLVVLTSAKVLRKTLTDADRKQLSEAAAREVAAA